MKRYLEFANVVKQQLDDARNSIDNYDNVVRFLNMVRKENQKSVKKMFSISA